MAQTMSISDRLAIVNQNCTTRQLKNMSSQLFVHFSKSVHKLLCIQLKDQYWWFTLHNKPIPTGEMNLTVG